MKKIFLGLFKSILNWVKKYKIPILLFLIFCFALAIRIFPSLDIVFSDPIKYSADDGIYHMRLVENILLGGHFPFRIYFDPYTNFPHGTYIHFTPLYDWLLAVIIWAVSFGKPTLEAINKIAPFYPAVMGALIVFIVYFLTKSLFKNKATALLAAFLSGISGTFLYRSLLGNTDHHVAEVVFSTLTMMFLIFSLQAKKYSRKFWIFVLLAGFSLGLYFLAWTGAIMFLFLIFVFIIFYYLLEYFLNKKQNWILYLGMIIFTVAFLMIFPFLGHPDLFNTYMYNIVHMSAFLLGFLSFIILLLLDKIFLLKKINAKWMPVFFILAIILLLLILKLIFPVLFNALLSGAKEINIGMVEYPLARELVGEMQPIKYNGLVDGFQMVFFVSIMAVIVVIFKFIKEKKSEFLLVVLWAVFIIFMSGIIPNFGQTRFSCYLSPVFSILFAFLFVKMVNFGWQGLQKAKELTDDNLFKKYVSIGSAVILILAIYFICYPFPFNAGLVFPHSLPNIFGNIIYSCKLLQSESDRYETCEWLKDNTPDTGVDYYQLYKEPGINKTTGKVNSYQYPDSAYGILAVWDFGHMITYYGHRIPVSNPFQEGIGRKNKDGTIIPGYATFFLERDEKTAIGYLDQLKAKYVIADSASANTDGVYQQMIKWQQDNFEGYLTKDGENIDMEKYYASMIARLSLFDGRQTNFEVKNTTEIKNFNVEALSHFRLVYESKENGMTLKIDQNQDVKKYKVFEYVKGAKIKGFANFGAKIEISTEIKTNQGRSFVYKNSVVAENGKFEIIVPYAKKYSIKIGKYIKEVEVLEQDILNGNIINL